MSQQEQFCGGLGIYQKLIDFAGAGATVPLTGFGSALAKGAVEEVQTSRIIRRIYWRSESISTDGISAAIFFGYLASLIAKPKMKKQ